MLIFKTLSSFLNALWSFSDTSIENDFVQKGENVILGKPCVCRKPKADSIVPQSSTWNSGGSCTFCKWPQLLLEWLQQIQEAGGNDLMHSPVSQGEGIVHDLCQTTCTNRHQLNLSICTKVYGKNIVCRPPKKKKRINFWGILRVVTLIGETEE